MGISYMERMIRKYGKGAILYKYHIVATHSGYDFWTDLQPTKDVKTYIEDYGCSTWEVLEIVPVII